MVHGDCRSAGCYAMTDALIEEIYALAREAFKGGQRQFHVHAFPFRMTAENMKRHGKSKWYGFWKTMKPGYDDFELTHVPPKVYVCSKQYLVNAKFIKGGAPDSPSDTCPAYRRVPGLPQSAAPILAQKPAAPSPAALTSSRVAANNLKNPKQRTSTTTVQPISLSTAAPVQPETKAPASAEAPVEESTLVDVERSGKSDMMLPTPGQ